MRISDWSSDVCSSDLDRDGGADDLFDDRGIRRHARGDLRRAVFLEEAGGEAEQVALHRLADVGAGALAEPAHEIEAQRGGEGEGEDDDLEQNVRASCRDIVCQSVYISEGDETITNN